MTQSEILYESELTVQIHAHKSPMGNDVLVHLLDGIKVEVLGQYEASYHVQFMDADTNENVWDTVIGNNCWTMPNIHYYVRWHVLIYENDVLTLDYTLNLADAVVWIAFSSHALGDTVSWFPFVDEFRKKHNCKVITSTKWNKLFASVYPEIEFVEPGKPVVCDVMYQLGSFDDDPNRLKNNWRTIPLQQIASDTLGLPAQEIRAKLISSNGFHPIKEKYVCISEYSSFLAKHWLRKNGWSRVVEYLRHRGYLVVSVSREHSFLPDTIKANGLPVEEAIAYIRHCAFFIGVSSGLSVVAWNLNKPVVIISGIGGKHREMSDKCYRVINEQVCCKCSDDISLPIDRLDWLWCPRNNDFICSKSITANMVIDKIETLIADDKIRNAALHE